MTAAELSASAGSDSAPPAGLSAPLVALWYAKAGQWERAHDLSSDLPDPQGAWIHAYLHRDEGDLTNAAYWYARAGRPVPPPSLSLENEWQEIALCFSV